MLTVVAYCAAELRRKAMANRLTGHKVVDIFGTNGQVMHEWVNVQVPWRAAAAGATVENGGMYIYRDVVAMSSYSEPLLNGLRSGGCEQMGFILGVPMLYISTDEEDTVYEAEAKSLQLSDGTWATGATVLLPKKFEKNAAGEIDIEFNVLGTDVTTTLHPERRSKDVWDYETRSRVKVTTRSYRVRRTT